MYRSKTVILQQNKMLCMYVCVCACVIEYMEIFIKKKATKSFE